MAGEMTILGQYLEGVCGRYGHGDGLGREGRTGVAVLPPGTSWRSGRGAGQVV